MEIQLYFLILASDFVSEGTALGIDVLDLREVLFGALGRLLLHFCSKSNPNSLN